VEHVTKAEIAKIIDELYRRFWELYWLEAKLQSEIGK
jgi:hypothetical protein